MSKSKNLAHNEMERQERENDLLKRARDAGMNFRAVDMETIEEEGKQPVVRMSVSSEAPVLTWVKGIGKLVGGNTQSRENQYGITEYLVYEVLDHSESSIDRSRCADGLVIQDTHFGDQVALMRAPIITNKKFAGILEFCSGERAENIGKDAAKGLRKNSSVGYMADPQKYVIEGEKDGYPVVRCMRWTPYEASFVNVPADVSVGVGRSLQTENQKPEVTGKERIMEAKDIAQLFERAQKFGIDAAAVSALVADGNGRAELDAMIVEKQESDATAQRAEIQSLKKIKPEMPEVRGTTVPFIGGDPKTQAKIMRKYSLLNICRSLSGDNDCDIGLEREVSQECRKFSRHEDKGIIIPFCALAKRDFSVAGTSSATVETMLSASDFIELLRDKYLLGQLGAVFMPGVVGNISIPEMSAGATCYHVAEGGDITESTPTLGNKTGNPHTIGTLVDITRRMMLQSTPNAEMLVRDEITKRIMLGVQTDVFSGTGADGQPSAITTASGINNPSVTQGAPTFAEIVSFMTNIVSDNAETGNQKWAFTGEVMGKLATTMRNATYGEIPILDLEKPTMLSRPWFTSEGIPANSLWFGDWSTIVIPMWGAGVEVAADASKLFASGGLTLRALLDFDVIVRQGKALAYNTAVTA